MLVLVQQGSMNMQYNTPDVQSLPVHRYPLPSGSSILGLSS